MGEQPRHGQPEYERDGHEQYDPDEPRDERLAAEPADERREQHRHRDQHHEDARPLRGTDLATIDIAPDETVHDRKGLDESPSREHQPEEADRERDQALAEAELPEVAE